MRHHQDENSTAGREAAGVVVGDQFTWTFVGLLGTVPTPMPHPTRCVLTTMLSIHSCCIGRFAPLPLNVSCKAPCWTFIVSRHRMPVTSRASVPLTHMRWSPSCWPGVFACTSCSRQTH